MLSGKVLTAAFLLNRKYEDQNIIGRTMVACIEDMNKIEIDELKHYIQSGTFIR